MHFLAVQYPGRVGVGPVALDEVLAEAGHQLRGRVLAGVDGGVDDELRLGPRDGRVRQLQDLDVVAGQAAGVHLLPAVADVDPAGEVWTALDQALCGGIGLLHRPVTGEPGDALDLSGQLHAGTEQVRGPLLVHLDREAHVHELVPARAVHIEDEVSLVVVDLPRRPLGGQAVHLLAVGEPGAHDPRPVSGRRVRRGGKGRGREDDEQKDPSQGESGRPQVHMGSSDPP